MTSLDVLLSRRVGPLETTFSLPNLVDPETGKAAQLKLRVPTSVEIADLTATHTTVLPLSAAIVARYLIDPPLDSSIIQEACTTLPGAYVELETVAARVFTPEELVDITNHLFKVAKLDDPVKEVEETAKN